MTDSTNTGDIPHTMNALGQPIGLAVDTHFPRPRPFVMPMVGQFCRLDPITKAHAQPLLDAFLSDAEDRIWTYMPYGPLRSLDAVESWIEGTCLSEDPLFYTITDLTKDKVGGVASYLRITPQAGVIEVGHINFSPLIQRTLAATEAMYLMMRHIFEDLSYRRYEWKCDALNAKSQAAARRLGFVYEGTFRQATHYKGRNRDTAWFAILDTDWPALEGAFEAYFAPKNFDADGVQIENLQSFHTPVR